MYRIWQTLVDMLMRADHMLKVGAISPVEHEADWWQAYDRLEETRYVYAAAGTLNRPGSAGDSPYPERMRAWVVGGARGLQQLGERGVVEEAGQRLVADGQVAGEHEHAGRDVVAVPFGEAFKAGAQGAQAQNEEILKKAADAAAVAQFAANEAAF